MPRKKGGYPPLKKELSRQYMVTRDPVERRKISIRLRNLEPNSWRAKLPQSRWNKHWAEWARNRMREGAEIDECRHCGGMYPRVNDTHHWCSRACITAGRGPRRGK